MASMECRENDSNLAQIVIRHTLACFEATNVRRDEFVKGGLINNLIESGSLGEEPTDADEFQRWQKTKCKQIERILKGESPMPSDFVFGWVAALPDEYRTKCMNDICGAFGTFYTPLFSLGATSKLTAMQANLSDVSKEFADVLANATPAMDGLYDQEDSREQLQQLANELFELQAKIVVELGSIKLATGIMPSAYVSMANSQLFKTN
ncbi:hypothetical protein E1100_25680 [Vibrio owensii]|uniref:hypothetical protein n=1 Tax=Vibrio owensii TaxID=696485 RepID=UPI0010468564|nr:hypothetical protein [Vibrio owensii]TDE19253.1 hypothetical protein E1100_25680 [Vibrio owensii]